MLCAVGLAPWPTVGTLAAEERRGAVAAYEAEAMKIAIRMQVRGGCQGESAGKGEGTRG